MSVLVNNAGTHATIEAHFESDGAVQNGVRPMRGLIWSHKNSHGVFHDSWIDDFVANFSKPVDFNVQHSRTVFDKSLGKLEQIWIGEDKEGEKALFGRWHEPAWVKNALGDVPRKVSIEVDFAQKSLTGIALVYNPAVEEAAMMSEFAKFSQSTLDNSSDTQYDNNADVNKGNNKSMADTFKEWFSELRNKPKAERQEIADTFKGLVEEDFSDNAETPREKQLREALDAERQRNAQFSQNRAETEAQSWIDEQVSKGKVAPVDAPRYKSAYSALAQVASIPDQRLAVVKFSADENGVAVEKEVSQLEVFKELFEKLPSNKITDDVSATLRHNQQRTDVAGVKSFSEVEEEVLDWMGKKK